MNAPLAELTVLVADCQTTGASPALGSVLELGWCLSSAAQPELELGAQAHWILPAPGERVSATVRKLTGFEDAVLESALTPEVAWQRLRATMTASATPMPAAIHFARFELAFLQDWSQRFEPAQPFPLQAVCVHAIAVKLFPDLPRRNLRALAGFLGHGLHLERRALGHVLATAFIWRKLVAELQARGVGDWRELQAWLAAPRESAPRQRRYPLPPTRYRALPEQPGVYRFLRSNGDVLYVGKATSLKKRVSSHFTKQAGATERALEMLTQVSDVAFIATPSALEAALLETRTIKELNPPYNVQLVQGDRSVWFSSSDWSRAELEPSAVHATGPLPSRHSLRALRALAELLAGEPETPARRAAAVGAPTRWAPDEASFAEGFAIFGARHVVGLPSGLTPRQRALRIGRALLAQAPEEAPETDADEPKLWDGPRVCRHLERAVGQAQRVLRRASWLCLLASSSVSYREPGGGVTRCLRIERAALLESADLPADASLPAPERAPRLMLQRSFDAAGYDALRVLNTELKRILRDGGEVTVRLSRTRALSGSALAQVLALT